MPKNWDDHKKDIERLYITEKRTLKDVRRIMKDVHCFDASTRAYQMRFDVWGKPFLKYRQQPTHSARSSSSHRHVSPDASDGTVDESTEDLRYASDEGIFTQQGAIEVRRSQDWKSFEDAHWEITDESPSVAHIMNLAAKKVDNSDIAARARLWDFETYSQAHMRPETMLTKMLEKKQLEGHYLEQTLYILRNLRQGIEIAAPTTSASTLFKFVDDNFPSEDSGILTKALLEADLTPPLSSEYPLVMWRTFWRAASNSGSWDEANKLLYEGCQNIELLGSVFIDAARIVLAERLLKQHMANIEAFQTRCESLTATEVVTIAILRRSYMGILEDCDRSELELSSQLYKFALKFAGQESTTRTLASATNSMEVISTSKESLSELNKICSSYDGGVDQVIQNLTLTINMLRNMKTVFPAAESKFGQHDPSDLHLSFVGRMGLDEISLGNLPVQDSTKRILDTLLSKFRAGSLDQQAIVAILQEDGEELSIFQESRKHCENFFDALHKYVPAMELHPFMRVLLVLLGNSFSRSPAFEWWRSVFYCSKWTIMRALVAPEEVLMHIGNMMLPETAKSLLDITIKLAGERLLGVLKREMDREKENITQFGHDPAKYVEMMRENAAILETFRERGFMTDHSHFEYLLRLGYVV